MPAHSGWPVDSTGTVRRRANKPTSTREPSRAGQGAEPVVRPAAGGFIFGAALNAATSDVATVHHRSTRDGMQKNPAIPSCVLSNPEKIGFGTSPLTGQLSGGSSNPRTIVRCLSPRPALPVWSRPIGGASSMQTSDPITGRQNRRHWMSRRSGHRSSVVAGLDRSSQPKRTRHRVTKNCALNHNAASSSC